MLVDLSNWLSYSSLKLVEVSVSKASAISN